MRLGQTVYVGSGYGKCFSGEIVKLNKKTAKVNFGGYMENVPLWNIHTCKCEFCQ